MWWFTIFAQFTICKILDVDAFMEFHYVSFCFFVFAWRTFCLPGAVPATRLMYTQIMEMMFWKASSLLSGNHYYITLQSSSAWWNKVLNISLQHVPSFMHTHTHLDTHFYLLTDWQCGADPLMGFHCILSGTHITHNPTGSVLCRTVNLAPI